MAKGKYKDWLTEDGLTRLKGWARDGLTDEQIAHNMGISRSTLSDWKIKYPDIEVTLKKEKEVVDYEVENALLKNALSGNVTAQIYWLKNRKPDKWRERNEPIRVDATEDSNIIQAITSTASGLFDDDPEAEDG